MKSPLLGTAYTARSKDLANQRCVNLFLESVETKSGSAPAALYGCPGLLLALALGLGPVRATQPVGDLLYVVSGNQVYSVAASLTATLIGTIGTSAGPVTIVYNPTQVGFFDSASAHSWSGGVFAAIGLPFSGPVGTAVYQDGFVLVSQPGTFNIWQSNLNDMTTWDPLNFTTEDGNAEPIIALVAFHDQIFVFKQFSFCPYVNAGLNGFAFQRLDGIYPATGCVAAATPIVVREYLLWVGQTENGEAKIYMTSAYEPTEISTYAITFAIDNYPTVTDAVAFGYVQEGHSFYVVNFPSGNATWAIDVKESLKMSVGVWHERAAFNGGQFNMYEPQCAAQFGGAIYAGSGVNGNLYKLDMDTYTDNGKPRKWLRSWRATPEAQYGTEKVNFLDIQCETGIGVAPDANPQMVLRQSVDGGYTWSAERYAAVGKTGEVANDIRFNRLGATRRGLNSDRYLELSSTDPFKVSLLGAEIE